MSQIKVVAAVIIKNDQVLIAKRPDGKHKAGYWEFPGGKIETGESAEAALFRELKEELDIQIQGCAAFTEVFFEYPGKKIHLQFFIVEQFAGEPKGMEGQPIQWVNKNELTDYPFPEANLAVVKLLLGQSD